MRFAPGLSPARIAGKRSPGSRLALEDAVLVAEELRRAIAALEFSADGSDFRITASFGVAQAAPQDQTIEDVVRRADRALYRAKTNGRNQVERSMVGTSD